MAVLERLESDKQALSDQVDKLTLYTKTLEKGVENLKTQVAQSQVGDLDQSARLIKGVKVLAAHVDGLDRAQLRALADSLRSKWKTGVVVLGTTQDSQVAILTAVTKDLTARVHAGKLAATIASAVGGKGGGRPDMAEAGGNDPSALPAALEHAYAAVEGML